MYPDFFSIEDISTQEMGSSFTHMKLWPASTVHLTDELSSDVEILPEFLITSNTKNTFRVPCQPSDISYHTTLLKNMSFSATGDKENTNKKSHKKTRTIFLN